MNYADGSRRYQHVDGLVHRSSDSGLGATLITWCERYGLYAHLYDSLDLEPTEAMVTCLECVALSMKER